MSLTADCRSRRLRGLTNEQGDCCPNEHILGPTERVEANPALTIDQDQRGRPAHRVALHGLGDGPCGEGRSTATGNLTAYSCKKASSDAGPIAAWCSNTECNPTTATSSGSKLAAIRCACGTPWATQPGQRIWNACRATTLPRKASSSRSAVVLNQRSTLHRGAGCASAAAINLGPRVISSLPR